MMSIQRYWMDTMGSISALLKYMGATVEPCPDDDGEWVRYTDHCARIAALEAERDALRAALVKVREQIGDVECESWADSVAVGRCIETIDTAIDAARTK